MRFFPLLIFLFLTSSVAAPADRSQCNGKDLERQDCRLRSKALKLQLSSKKISWSDGVWRKVDDLPVGGEGFTWEKVRLLEIKKRKILQMWIWDVPTGEVKVQNLHWVVMEFVNHEMKLVTQRVVRKRRPQAATDEKAPVVYLKDPMDLHGVKESKGALLRWTHGDQSAEF